MKDRRHLDNIGALFNEHLGRHNLRHEHYVPAFRQVLEHRLFAELEDLHRDGRPEALAEAAGRRRATVLLVLAAVEHYAAQSIGAEKITAHNVMGLDQETLRVLEGLNKAAGRAGAF